jgi:hypothetical protein
MKTVLRRCTKCDLLDARRQWSSVNEAAGKGALAGYWACPNCAWPEAELIVVDVSELRAQQPGFEELVSKARA